jgi:hypothetical protein
LLSTATHSQRNITARKFLSTVGCQRISKLHTPQTTPRLKNAISPIANALRLSISGVHLHRRSRTTAELWLLGCPWPSHSSRTTRGSPIPTTIFSMRSQSSRLWATIALALLASTTSATTVSLASFIPRIDNLPSACGKVYNTVIAGCVASDFSKGTTCSAACVRGLNAIAQEVQSECANVDAGEISIIGVFQNGLGIQSLCPGVTVVTGSSSSEKQTSTTTEVQKTSTQAVVTATTKESSSAAETTSTAASSTTEADDGEESSTAQVSASSSSSSTGGLTLDPNATGAVTTTAVVAPPTDTATSSTKGAAATAQLSNADSGGGSPFDIVATGSSPQGRVFDSSVAGLLATAVLLVACA